MDNDDIREVDLPTPAQGRPSGPPLTVRIFGVVFALIGASFAVGILSMRTAAGGPPLPFLAVGVLVCAAFVFLGITVAIGRSHRRGFTPPPSVNPDLSAPGAYACPSCGAALGKDADVSPHGDVRCAYCERWFNVHGRAPH